ncbi:hypothetical protein BaRGS_00032568 [Batillaria attramentaria]|uniref:Uncharacterized protein n=1 Tax=Batillaria attramentaria TaxID=370345 RepID=A0ABD0JN21_9CAEN
MSHISSQWRGFRTGGFHVSSFSLTHFAVLIIASVTAHTYIMTALLTKESPTGRSFVCLEHLGMQDEVLVRHKDCSTYVHDAHLQFLVDQATSCLKHRKVAMALAREGTLKTIIRYPKKR